jgi:hypothetical protein
MAFFASNTSVFGSNTISSITGTTIRTSNVGVGTLTPATRLQVIGGKIHCDTQHLGASNDSSTVPSFSFLEDSNTGLFHASNAAIGFSTAGIERIRIDNNGNVGVGTTTAGYKMDVNGDLNFRGTLRSNGVAFASSMWSNNGSNVYTPFSSVKYISASACNPPNILANVDLPEPGNPLNSSSSLIIYILVC